MIWIVLAPLLLLALWSEWSLYHNDIRQMKSHALRKTYVCASVALWAWIAGLKLYFTIDQGYPAGLYRAFEATVPLFIFMCAAKLYFALAGALGRRQGNRRGFRIAAWLLTLTTGALMLYGFTAGRRQIRLERVAITSEAVPPGADGLRIALFADAHIGTLLDRRLVLRRMVDRINDLGPDIVICAGDLVNNDHTELEPEILAILGSIRSTHGVFMAPGNHEKEKYIRTKGLSGDENTRELQQRLATIGWRLLIDQTATIPLGTDTIYITGLDFPDYLLEKNSHTARHQQVDYSAVYAGLPAGSLNITIAHTPRMWEDVMASGNALLTLSGHVHAMQMRIPLGGGRHWSPARLLYRHWSGLYRQDEHWLYVNGGVGYSLFPMRLGAAPEVTLIELTR